MPPQSAASATDWLEFCRRAGDRVRRALETYGGVAERSEAVGRGEGGDMTLAIDRAAEEAVFAELEALGAPVTAISEERGEVAIAGGGPERVVIDPIDGSLNARRRLPFYCVSLAVAGGPTMGDVELGYVLDLSSPDGDEWWARRAEGAFLNGERLAPLEPSGPVEMLGIEAAHPRLVAAAAETLAGAASERVRGLGSIALSMCLVAAGRLDAMLSLRAARSVDAAAGQLIVREAGGAVAFPEAAEDPLDAPLDLAMRSRVLAATGPAELGRLLELPAVAP